MAEILVKEHFAKKDKVTDISGENRGKHPYDGTCPNDEPYDVKSSKLYEYGYWSFSLDNIDRDEIEWYYLLGFNKDYSELQHVWRIPAWDFIKDIEKGYMHIGINDNRKDNIENMKQYEITEKVMQIFKDWKDTIKEN